MKINGLRESIAPKDFCGLRKRLPGNGLRSGYVEHGLFSTMDGCAALSCRQTKAAAKQAGRMRRAKVMGY